MYYTIEMAKAFHSVTPPKGFSVEVMDDEFFLTVRADEKMFFSLSHRDKLKAIEYMVRVKSALEDNGAIVLLVRSGGKD